MATCSQCGRDWRTKSGNLVCGRCQHYLAKHPCADCGTPCDKRAVRCLACAPLQNVGYGKRGGKGRYTNRTTGYVVVLAPGHPRAGKNGYVREHVVVMEETIGRFLFDGETVHHKNGQRDDNRPENLELWAKSQPAGQRVEDLLAWAHDLIALYERPVS